jgi:hypothetical protein
MNELTAQPHRMCRSPTTSGEESGRNDLSKYVCRCLLSFGLVVVFIKVSSQRLR